MKSVLNHRLAARCGGVAGVLIAAAAAFGVCAPALAHVEPAPAGQPVPTDTAAVRYKVASVRGQEIFYREAGAPDAPAIVLLHGFPSSSHMFRDLLPRLSDRFRVIAPDYPGFGKSSQPPVGEFEYTFDNLSGIVDEFTQQLGLKTFALYVHDYGAPIGFRIAAKHPERITGLIIQNGNAYEEGLPDAFWGPIKQFWKSPTPELRAKLADFLKLDGTKWQYLHGAHDPASISPDAWLADQAGLDRPGNADVQLALLKDYGTNPPLYPQWQEYFRKHQPPTLVVWGKNDQIFPPAGAEPYKRDLKNIDFNLLDAGHFAIEERAALIASKIRGFMQTRVVKTAAVAPMPAAGFDQFIFSKSKGFTDTGFYRAFAKAVPIKTVVVYCMDPRCVRVPEVVAQALPGEVFPGELVYDVRGRKVGSTATILPVVNAGGRGIDALRSITVGQHLFGLENIVLVEHTNCGVTSYTADGLIAAYQREQGKDLANEYERRDLAVSDFVASLNDDAKLLRSSAGVPQRVNIYGYVYDIDTERLTLVLEDKAR